MHERDKYQTACESTVFMEVCVLGVGAGGEVWRKDPRCIRWETEASGAATAPGSSQPPSDSTCFLRGQTALPVVQDSQEMTPCRLPLLALPWPPLTSTPSAWSTSFPAVAPPGSLPQIPQTELQASLLSSLGGNLIYLSGTPGAGAKFGPRQANSHHCPPPPHTPECPG